MSISCGFFNSENHDRKYDARDFGQLFDGIIRDGIFMSIGTCFMVTADGTDMNVTVGAGHAWFNQTWIDNDAPMLMEVPQSEILLNRIDTMIIEVNHSVDVRDCTVKLLKGQPATNPIRPELTNTHDVHQYALCDIYVGSEVGIITQANITNRVGIGEVPFVTGILETINIDSLIAQWGTEWREWLLATKQDQSKWTYEQRTEFLNWMSTQRNEFENYVSNFESDMDSWQTINFQGFDDWFSHIKDQLSTDAAGNLQNQIDDNYKKEFDRYYGIIDKITDINKNNFGETTSIVETSDEAVCTTTFNVLENGDKEIVTIIIPTTGIYGYKKTVGIKNVDAGKKITESYERYLKDL